MSCGDYEELIALEVEGDLPEREAGRLRRHLQDCVYCRGFLEELRASQSVLKSLGREPADDLVLRRIRLDVIEEIQTGAAKFQWGPDWIAPFRWGTPRLATGVLLALLLVALGWWAISSREPPQSPYVELAEGESEVQRKAGPSVVPPAERPRPVSKSGSRLEESPPTETLAGAIAEATRSSVPRMDDPAAAAVESQPARAESPAPYAESQGRPASNAVAPPPRFEVVSMPSGDSGGDSGSEGVLLKIATNDPKIVIYWVLDENGGNDEEPDDN